MRDVLDVPDLFLWVDFIHLQVVTKAIHFAQIRVCQVLSPPNIGGLRGNISSQDQSTGKKIIRHVTKNRAIKTLRCKTGVE